MPLTAFVDTASFDELIKRIEAMQHRVAHFKAVDIGHELSQWQTEDMHRKRPFTKRSPRAGRAVTLVRPHSKYEMNRAKAARISAHRHHRGGPSHTSTRPILRETLFQQLTKRMVNALRDKIHW